MQSTLAHAVEQLGTFGIDVDPSNCDSAALRADAEDVRNGVTPLHLSALPPIYAADLMDTVADIIDAPMECQRCGEADPSRCECP